MMQRQWQYVNDKQGCHQGEGKPGLLISEYPSSVTKNKTEFNKTSSPIEYIPNRKHVKISEVVK